MVNFLRKLFYQIIKFMAKRVYDPSYLTGRWFDNCETGWKWAWENMYWQKVRKINAGIPWPVSPFVRIGGSPSNIIFDPENLDNFMGGGCIFSAIMQRFI